MPLDPSYVGRVSAANRPYEVGREKIRDFALAIGDQNPVYVDVEAARAAGHPDVIAPPTFLFSVVMPWTGAVVMDPGLGVDYGRLVHGEQSFEHLRPVRPGDRLTGTVVIEHIGTAGRNEVLTYRAEVGTVEGEPVATLRSTIIIRGTAPRPEGDFL